MKIRLTVAGVIVAFIFALSLAVLPVLSVDAQQSGKKFRIGFLDTGQSVAVPKLLTDLG